MAGSTLQTNPFDLYKFMDNCAQGLIQLPDFQRSWVWDEDRIKSLIASISRAFPVGALMTLDTGGSISFKPGPVEGAPPEARLKSPESLLLDGKQRMTSLFQVTLRGKVVETETPKKKVKRWFYFNIRQCLDPMADREEAVVGVPGDRVAGEKQRAGSGGHQSGKPRNWNNILQGVAAGVGMCHPDPRAPKSPALCQAYIQNHVLLPG